MLVRNGDPIRRHPWPGYNQVQGFSDTEVERGTVYRYCAIPVWDSGHEGLCAPVAAVVVPPAASPDRANRRLSLS